MRVVETARRGEVTVRDLSKSFTLNGQRLNVLRDLDLGVASGAFLAIVGPSGCGKTTLLRVLAGLECADKGQVLIDGHPVEGVGHERAVIFQEPRLLPWLTVLGNVAFGLLVRGTPRDVAEARDRTGGRLDAVFHNGAYAIPAPVEDVPVAAMRAIFEANFFGWHELTRHVVPVMRGPGAGRPEPGEPAAASARRRVPGPRGPE